MRRFVFTLPTLILFILVALTWPLSLMNRPESNAAALPRPAPASDAPSQQGDRIVVDSQVDAVDTAPGDGQCATASGECTLRAAVMEANALADYTTIVVPTGTYKLTLPPAPDDPAQGGDLDIAAPMDIIGSGQSATIVEGPGESGEGFGVFDIHAAVSVTLRSLTIRRGSGPFGGVRSDSVLSLVDTAVLSNTARHGGGVLSNNALHVLRSRIAGNSAQTGGGIVSRGHLEIADALIEGNEAEQGGGVLLEPGTVITAPRIALTATRIVDNSDVGILDAAGFQVVISRSLLTGHPAAGYRAPARGTLVAQDSGFTSNGWGIELGEGGTAVLTSCEFSMNHRGASRVEDGVLTAAHAKVERNNEGFSSSGATLRVLRSAFYGNSSTPIIDRNKGTVYISASSIISNTSDLGGGVAMSNQGRLTIFDSTIAHNRASQQGGGVYIGNGGVHLILNSTIAANAAGRGDNIRNGGDLTLVHSTLFNAAGSGGRGEGINNVQTVTLVSNILAAEPPALACSRYEGGTIESRGTNVASDESCRLDEDQGDIEGIDPLLGPLTRNGGPTDTMALLANSPAIDHAGEYTCPETDQRRAPRPYSRRCDSGAFEYGASPPPVPPPGGDYWLEKVLVRGAVLAGVGDDAPPVAGAKVLVTAQPGHCGGVVETDSDGHFAVTCRGAHLLGTIEVLVEADGYERWSETYLLGPFGWGGGPVGVDARLVWAGGPTPTPPPPTPAAGAFVPLALKAAPVR